LPNYLTLLDTPDSIAKIRLTILAAMTDDNTPSYRFIFLHNSSF